MIKKEIFVREYFASKSLSIGVLDPLGFVVFP